MKCLDFTVVEEALRAARRVNDYSTAVRIFEGLSASYFVVSSVVMLLTDCVSSSLHSLYHFLPVSSSFSPRLSSRLACCSSSLLLTVSLPRRPSSCSSLLYYFYHHSDSCPYHLLLITVLSSLPPLLRFRPPTSHPIAIFQPLRRLCFRLNRGKDRNCRTIRSIPHRD